MSLESGLVSKGDIKGEMKMESESDYPKVKKEIKVECPVCQGEKIFSEHDLFAGTVYKEKCKLCKGEGIVKAMLVAE